MAQQPWFNYGMTIVWLRHKYGVSMASQRRNGDKGIPATQFGIEATSTVHYGALNYQARQKVAKIHLVAKTDLGSKLSSLCSQIGWLQVWTRPNCVAPKESWILTQTHLSNFSHPKTDVHRDRHMLLGISEGLTALAESTKAEGLWV